MRPLRFGMLIGTLAVAAMTGTASANHAECKAAGGFIIQQVGPTGADLCVSVRGDGVRVGTDAINNCTFTGGCTTVGTHAELVNGQPDVCFASALNGTLLLAVCPV